MKPRFKYFWVCHCYESARSTEAKFYLDIVSKRTIGEALKDSEHHCKVALKRTKVLSTCFRKQWSTVAKPGK